MKKQLVVLYVIIILICIISLIVAVYTQVEQENTNTTFANSKNEIIEQVATQEDLKREFNSFFINSITVSNYDVSTIQKNDETKPIVDSVHAIRTGENKFDITVNIPIFNIKSSITDRYNTQIQSMFLDKANSILASTSQSYTIYSVDYTGYINGDVISLVIKSTLKEGSNPQRDIVATYNYNLKTGKEATIYDLMLQVGVEEKSLEKGIKEQVNKAIKEANEIQATGYNVYTRDINDKMYNIENLSTYFLGPEGELYVIFPYGNKNLTSEMDIIKM